MYPCFSEAYKNRIVEESTIYKRPDGQLKVFEKCVNSAAKDLCLALLSRSTLLELARKKVAEEGYTFKKGHSRWKVYGKSLSDMPKRPKFDEKMREERIHSIEEELTDISRILQFKEKRLSQHEVDRNYRSCEQVTEEMMSLKGRKRELEGEKTILLKKARRAKKRKRAVLTSDTSDVAPSSPSPGSSRPVTPHEILSSSVNSSVNSPARSPESDSENESIEQQFQGSLLTD